MTKHHNIEIAADIPQDADEDDDVEQRGQHTGGHADLRFRRHTHILGDPVFRVPVLALLELELQEAIVCQPAFDQMPGQPSPPSALRRHTRPDGQDRHQDAQAREQQE